MIVLILAAGVAAVAALIWFAVWLMDRDDHRDPFAHAGLIVDAATVMDLGPMPPEVAHEPPRRSIHELPALGDAVWHQLPMTSPARNPAPPVAPGTGAGPGTAAAAEAAPSAIPPAPAPPPLPDPAYAAANPTAYPLAWLLSDTFVGGLTAIKDGAP